jgi:hypothetical protein
MTIKEDRAGDSLNLGKGLTIESPLPEDFTGKAIEYSAHYLKK